MKDEQIIKALECCGVNCDCAGCPKEKEPYGCYFVLCGGAFDLINRQKATIERQVEAIKIAHKLVEKQKAEIERLKKENEFHRKTITNNAQRALEVTIEEVEKAKSEAINGFAEKFKAKINKYEYRDKDPNMKQKGQWILHEVIPMEVDKLLKEMDGD